jgi:hypothetical protein
VDAHGKLLILWRVVSLSTLNTLSIFTFHKLLLDSKMLKMFILSGSVIKVIIFRSCFLLIQHVRKYGPQSSLAAPFGPDAEDSFRSLEATVQAQRD